MAPSIIDNVKETLGVEDKKSIDMMKDIHTYQDPKNRLTTDYGVKQTNTDHWLSVSTEDKTGPSLLEDHASREKINRFDHERIPERVVHARGAGAFGKHRLLMCTQRLTLTSL